MPKTIKRTYLVPILSKALDILELLQSQNKALTLEFMHQRTGVSKTTVYRVLQTLVHRGYVVRAPDGTYRNAVQPKKLKFGFAGQSVEMPFSQDVSRSIRLAATDSGIELVELDNHYDAEIAVKNAEEFIRGGVDVIIEFNVEQSVAAVIGDKVAAAQVPFIAIDIPHPNATFFGVDNYRVGVEAGEVLAQYALEVWKGKVKWVLGLDLPEAGLLVQARVTGAFDAVRIALPHLTAESFVRLDGRGLRDVSARVVADFLSRHPHDKHILIAAATDTSALGAIDAARASRRTKHITVVGQDCITEALEEMRKPASPLIASVSHETKSYGPTLVRLGLALVKGQTVPPYNYVKHRLVTRALLLESE